MTESVEEPRLPSPKERRRLREAADLTYEAVATAVGVKANTVRSWESGRTQPRGRKRELYAAFLESLVSGTAAPETAPAGPGAAPAAAAADTRTASARTAAASAEAPGAAPSAGAAAPSAGAAAPSAGAHEPAGAAPGGTSAAGTSAGMAPVRLPGAMRPFGMSGHGPRTRPPGAAERAARPPAAVPRHKAKFTVKATARAIGTPGPLPCPAPVLAPAPAEALAHPPAEVVAASPEACEQPLPGPEGPGPAPGEVSDPAEAAGQAPEADATAAPEGRGQAAAAPGPAGPGAAFDALYEYAAPALARQAYLLTGRRRLAQEAVERAFQQAWARWPEVAVDPDPVGWVRAAVYEYALSPWHGLRRAHKHPDKAPAAPADRILMDAMLALQPAHRRTVLLYDGVGLDLPDTAAETEASTPTTGNRLLHAHAALADRIPELAAAPPERRSAVLRERLGAVTPAVPLEPRPASSVRLAAEYRTTRWTRAFLGLTAVIAVATAYTTVTAPRQYEPPIAPGASVSGVPPLAGPQRLTDETRQLRERLRAHPAHRPERLSPSLE